MGAALPGGFTETEQSEASQRSEQPLRKSGSHDLHFHLEEGSSPITDLGYCNRQWVQLQIAEPVKKQRDRKVVLNRFKTILNQTSRQIVADTICLHTELNLVTIHGPPVGLSTENSLSLSQGLENLNASVSKAKHRAWQR